MHASKTVSAAALCLLFATLVAGTASAQEAPVQDEPVHEEEPVHEAEPVLSTPVVELTAPVVELTAPRAELPPTHAAPRDSFGLALTLVVPGAAAVLGGGVLLTIAGVASADSFDIGAPDQDLIFAGSVLVALGIPVLIGGLYWLLDLTREAPGAAARAREPGVIRF